VQKDRGLPDLFMLVFSINWNQKLDEAKSGANGKIQGTNTLWLQFSRKAEQFTDTVFKINIFRKEITGEQISLGNGNGFLVFDKEKAPYLN
jgi:hypothetical protein